MGLPDGFREVRVPLLGIPCASKIWVIGDPAASRIVYLQAGFPDDQRAFVAFARRLAADGCLCGCGCMPEFDTPGTAPLLRPGGYTHDETAQCFDQAVSALRAHSTNAKAELSLVLHDWGVAPGMIFANRTLRAVNAGAQPNTAPTKIVAFDVMVPPKGVDARFNSPSPYASFNHLVYRGLFAVAFVLSRIWGMLGSLYLGLVMIIVFGMFGRWMSPVGALDRVKGKSGSRTNLNALCRMAYPYFHMFKEGILGGALISECHMPDLNQVRLLYIYGKDKNTMFHSASDLAAIDTFKGSAHVGIENAAHWVYLQQEDRCFELVRSFFSRS